MANIRHLIYKQYLDCFKRINENDQYCDIKMYKL